MVVLLRKCRPSCNAYSITYLFFCENPFIVLSSTSLTSQLIIHDLPLSLCHTFRIAFNHIFSNFRPTFVCYSTFTGCSRNTSKTTLYLSTLSYAFITVTPLYIARLSLEFAHARLDVLIGLSLGSAPTSLTTGLSYIYV